MNHHEGEVHEDIAQIPLENQINMLRCLSAKMSSKYVYTRKYIQNDIPTWITK